MNQPAPGDTQGWADYIRANPYHNMPQPLRRADGFEPLKLFALTERLRAWASVDVESGPLCQVIQDVRWLLDWDVKQYHEIERLHRASLYEKEHDHEVTWRERAEELEAKLKAAQSVMWMAEAYAEAGGSHGIEMSEFSAVKEVLNG